MEKYVFGVCGYSFNGFAYDHSLRPIFHRRMKLTLESVRNYAIELR